MSILENYAISMNSVNHKLNQHYANVLRWADFVIDVLPG